MDVVSWLYMFILYDDHYIEYGRKGLAIPNMDEVNFIHSSITLRKVASYHYM